VLRWPPRQLLQLHLLPLPTWGAKEYIKDDAGTSVALDVQAHALDTTGHVVQKLL
jgi:hypothetical protein